MKLAKGAIFFFLMSILGSCFNPPEFPIAPQIGFKSIEFVKVGGISDPDSLILTISFKDGDGDLGFDPDNAADASYPYHPIDYYLEKNGVLTKVPTEMVNQEIPPIIKIEPGQTGKLVTVRTRNNPLYSDLPEYVKPFNCTNYIYDSVYVSALNKDIFDATYNLVDSFDNVSPKVYVLLDTFYYDYNPNHYNITVKFEKKTNDANNPYIEFDWRAEYCATTYDGRFPVLNESNNKIPLDGTLRYTMNSTGFISIFSGQTLRLKVQIKDRALHLSNTITTPDFKIE